MDRVQGAAEPQGELPGLRPQVIAPEACRCLSARAIAVRWTLVGVALVAAEVLLMRCVDRAAAEWGLRLYGTDLSDYLGGAGVPLGGPLPYVAAIALLLWAARRYAWPRGRRFALLLPLVFAATGLGSFAVKIAVGRQRPFMLHEPQPTFASAWERRLDRRFQSFPSSDVMVAAGLAMTLFLLLESGPARYALFAIPAYSAFGRVLIARHYPSDCLAAAALGMVVAWLLWRWQERRAAAAPAAHTDAPDPPAADPAPPAPAPDDPR
jgi:membrane-associated phospholipid phosphatase